MYFIVQKLSKTYPVILFLLFIGFVYLISISSFPLSEGWWETYAYLDLNDVHLFQDIDISFTPLFVYFNKILLNIFGPDFYQLRLLGVFSFSILTVVFFFFLKSYSGIFPATFSLSVASALFVSSDPFIAKDYHTYLHLLTVISFIFFSLSISTNRIRAIAGSVFLAITVFLIIALKQNVGLILAFAYLIGLRLESWNSEKSYTSFWIYLVALLFALASLMQSELFSDYLNLITQNDSKGSLIKVLFAFLRGSNQQVFLYSSLLTLSCVFLYWFNNSSEHNYYKKLLFQLGEDKKYIKLMTQYGNVIFAILFLLFIYFAPLTSRVIFFTIIVSSLELYFTALWFKKITVIYPLGYVFPLLSLVYANTTTAELDYNGQFEVIAITSSILISRWISSFNKFSVTQKKVLVIFLCILFLFWSAWKKTKNTYMWWIGPTHSITQAKFRSSYTQLNGLRIDEVTERILSHVHSFVEENSKSKLDSYFFNMPVFYILENKTPPFRSVIQWFDVITTQQVKKEYFSLLENPPENIVAFYPEKTAYTAHATMKNQKKPFFQERILSFFDNDITYKFMACENFSMRSLAYGEFSYPVTTRYSAEIVLNKIKAYNSLNNTEIRMLSNYYVDDLSEITEGGRGLSLISSSDSDVVLRGAEPDVIKFTNQIGRINKSGFQAVCFYKKR